MHKLRRQKWTCFVLKKEQDDGRLIYDVDFLVGNKEYDYEIDLYTGEILDIDLDLEGY